MLKTNRLNQSKLIIKNYFKPYFLTIILIFFLVFSQIIFSNKLTTSGKRLDELNRQITELEAENKELELEIIALSNLERLKKEAEIKNFTDKIVVTNLTVQKEIAFKP